MEKIPAASAMDWSIQLEKSIRSQKAGKSIEALEEIGRRLEWWNRKPELTYAEYRMFGLIPGEDKLFLNAIFLRLADAFRLGNKQIKNSVVKLFLRMKRRKKRDGGGIFSKCKLENYLELLSRVKEVFDKGDAEERALALLLFGCWSHFAKDCADVRYILLSSLVTGDVIEVKTALFAAGCFSELSDDFASVFLEILATMVLSQKISRGIKLAGGRAFAKMWCPFWLADKAYKTGLKLLMDSSEDDFSAVMLISLSRIASRWTLLIPTQIEVLTLFQSEGRSLHMQATSLRCHRFILSRGVCNIPSITGTIHKLFGILHRSELQPTLLLEALRLLHKILMFNLSTMPSSEIPELFLKLSTVVKIVLQSSAVSTRVLAVSVLADLSEKVLGKVDMVSGGTGCTLALKVISFVLDQILSLVTPKVGIYQTDFAAELEVKSLLNVLYNMADNHSYLQCLVLNNICLFIDRLMKMLNNVMDTEETGLSNHETMEFGSYGKPLLSKLMLYISKILVACLQNLEEIDAETSQVLDALKLQVENMCNCNYFGSYTTITYSLFLHLLSTFSCMRHMLEDITFPSRKMSLSCVGPILKHDKLTLDYSEKILGRNCYWYSYKAGKIAACQGAWSTAAFIFEQLMTVVQSASCSCWLKSLAQFSTSEKQIQLFVLSDKGASIATSESNLGERGGVASRTNYCNYIGNLLGACNTPLSAEEIFSASDTGDIFTFQRWFLALRAKVLKTAVDMLKQLDTILFNQDGTGTGGQLEGDILLPCTTSQALGPLIYTSMEIACRMKKLARELDLLLTSFAGMDRQSVMVVSALALSCSLMAFTAGFAFLVPHFHSLENYRKFGNSEEPLYASLIEDLVGRLHIECKTRKTLLLLLESFRNCTTCVSSRFRNEISYSSHEAIVLHKLCEYSVGEIFSMQKAGTRLQRDGDAVSQILNSGSQLLLNIITKLMLIPFRTPRHFFRVRPAISSELFVMNEDGQSVDGSSILSGSHLCLNMSFQFKNMPAGVSSQLNKVYCILNCTKHSQITIGIGECKGEAQFSWRDHKIDDVMDLNEKLLRYVNGSRETQANDSSMVYEYVCFELDERGQGFSTCLLDVSSFPGGSYRIKWHSGCVDSGGSYWSLLPVNAGPLFTVRDVKTVR